MVVAKQGEACGAVEMEPRWARTAKDAVGLVGILLRDEAAHLLTGELPEQIWQDREGCPGSVETPTAVPHMTHTYPVRKTKISTRNRPTGTASFGAVLPGCWGGMPGAHGSPGSPTWSTCDLLRDG